MKIEFNRSEMAMLLFVSLMSFVANLPEEYLGELVDRRLLLATLITVVVIALFRYLQVFLLLIITILAIGANLPQEMAESLGISQLVMMVALGILIALTLANRKLGLLPTGIEDMDASGDNDGSTPHVVRVALMNAIARGDVIALRGLLAMNVDINFSHEGSTPLHLAAEKGYSEIVQLLIDHGANSRIGNASGKTALEVALDKKKFVRTTEILFNASRPYLAIDGQREGRRGDADAWRDQHF